MTGALGRTYGGRVVGCIDHHEDEGKVPRDAAPRVIEKAGSCMSLVVEQCAEAWDALAKTDDGGGSEDRRVINEQLAYLALGPILIDTNALGSKDKTTAHDERAAAVAEAKIRSVSSVSVSGSGTGTDNETKEIIGPDLKRFFDEVSALKEDISGMSLRDILRKDYKEWTTAEDNDDNEGTGLRLGMSSVPQPFAFLVDKAGGEEAFVRELERWSASKGLDVTAVLTTCKAAANGGKFSRELLVWARTGPEVAAAVKRFAERNGKEKLGLGMWGDGRLDAEGGGSWRRCWTQAEVRNSRKQIAPMLRDALKGV